MFMHISVNEERENRNEGNEKYKENWLDSPMERKEDRIWNPTDLVFTPFPPLASSRTLGKPPCCACLCFFFCKMCHKMFPMLF